MKGIEREKVGPLPIWGWGLLSGLLVWGLYLLTLAPTTGFWDTSEYIATAHTLGLPHPPGNPFFVVFGRVWELALGWTGLPVARRINLLSATMSAGAAMFWFLALARIGARFWEDRRQVVVTAFVGVWIGATAFTVWSQSNLNEKVYTVSLFVVALVSYLAMVWEDEADGSRGDRILLLIGLVLGLGAANHTMSLLPLPALGLFALWHRWRAALRPATLGAAAALFAVGFTVQTLFVPIRSAQEPVIDEADPECESLAAALVTPLEVTPVLKALVPSSAVCEPLRASLAREQYGKPPLTERQAPIGAQYANYWQYFDWQWARTLPRGPRAAATMLFLFLALLGLWRHWQGDRKSFAYLGVLLFTMSIALVYYLNFRYGYSLHYDVAPDPNLHEVRERDYFYIIGFNVWGLYAGVGLAALWGQLSESIAGGAAGLSARLRASPVFAVALVPLFFNYGLADRTGDYAARDWAYNILQSVEPYAVLFTNGDNDTFPLWYLQEVEGIRRDVTVIVHSYLGTRWYPKQLRELTKPCPEGVDPTETPTTITCQRPFDLANAIAPYRAPEPEPPTRSIIAWGDRQIDSLGPGFGVGEDTTFRIGEWVTARVRGGGVLYFPDIMVYHIVQQSLGDRPVYFAATAPPVFSTWGLQPHLMRQGLAYKLVDGPLEATADTVSLAGQVPPSSPQWIDRVRTRELVWDVFQIEYLLDWERWPEPSTQASIPTQYYLAYVTLGAAEELVGNQAEAERAYARAERFARLAELP